MAFCRKYTLDSEPVSNECNYTFARMTKVGIIHYSAVRDTKKEAEGLRWERKRTRSSHCD